MKNFKKTMAMFLALAMLCSLCVCAGAATVYPDENSITHKEAVAVLTELEVLQGDENGFRPADGLTRAEGCTIVAKLLGQGNYSGFSGFSDMADAAWAEGVVAFCADMGIVCGNGDGTFCPNEALTGAAFAKMLLVSLGYDAASEGMTGSAWVGSVTRLAKQADLLIDLPAFSGQKAICREDAAQMAFNCLRATMVEYSGGTKLSSGELNLTVSGTRSNVAAIGKDYRGEADNDTCEFCEYYFKTLKLGAAASAGFGRPGHSQWTLIGKPIYALDSEDTLLESYTSDVKTGTLYNLIGKDAYEAIRKDSAKLTVYLDGNAVDASLNDYFVKGGSEAVLNSGNGVLTEIYMDDENNVTIVQIGTYLAQATDDYDKQHDELEVSVLGDKSIRNATLAGDDFAVGSCVLGDWFLIRIDGGEIVFAEPVKPITGKLTGYTVGKSLNVGNTKYEYAAAFDSEKFSQSDFAINSDMTLILDPYGFILGLEAKQAQTTRYLYVMELAKNGSFARSGYLASVIHADGSYAEISVKSVDGRTPAETDCGWFSYSQNGTGYALVKASGVTNVEGEQLAVIGNKVQFLYNNTAKEYLRSVRATADTVFTVTNSKGELHTYTGYAKVPTINAEYAHCIRVSVLSDTYGFARAVFIDAGEASVENEKETLNGTVFLISNGYTVSVDSKGNTCYTYSAILGGKQVNANLNAPIPVSGLYGNLVKDENGYLDAASLMLVSDSDDSFVALGVTAENISYTSGILTVKEDCHIVASGCLAFTINEKGEASICTVSQLVNRIKNSSMTMLYGICEGGKVTSIFAVSLSESLN